MFEASFAGSNMQEGRVVPATVVSVENDAVIVDVGLKTEGRIPFSEFHNDEKMPASWPDRRHLPRAYRECAG